MSIKVKALEWQDHRGHTFPDTWTARSPCGVYEIEERSASDSPTYIATGPLHVFIADMDSLEDAKAAAQADYERRILSAIEPSPDMREVVEALERLSENIASFDAEVAFELSNEGERADLWTDIDVNVEDLRIVVAALRSLTGAKP